MPVTPDLPTAGPWRRMYAHTEPLASDVLHYAENCLIADPVKGGAAVVRGGVTPLGTAGAAGNPAASTVLCLFLFYTSAGTPILGRLVHDAAAGGAHIDTCDGRGWVAGAWTTVVSAAVLNAAGLNLAAVTEVFTCAFSGKIVFSESTNKPWTWDGTAAGGVVRLTNAPTAYGRPTVYYAKLFFIKNSDRLTLVWSEENQANTGYEAGGYNNAWTLTQTTSQPLEAIAGTNAALWYWRARSTGRILGAVTPTFQASGVHDDVSTSVGCVDHRSVVVVGASEDLWWYDQSSRVRCWAAGTIYDPTPMAPGQDAAPDPFGFASFTWSRLGPDSGGPTITAQAAAFTRPVRGGPGSGRTQVAFTVATGDMLLGEGGAFLLFDAETRSALGYVTIPTVGSFRHLTRGLAVSIDPANPPWVDGECLMFAASGVGGGANACFQYGVNDFYYDYLYSAGAWIGGDGSQQYQSHAITGALGHSPDVESVFDRIDLEVVAQLLLNTTPIIFQTSWISDEYPTAAAAAAAVAPQAQTLNQGAGYRRDARLAYGISTVTRWLRVRVSFNGPAQGLGLRLVRAWQRRLVRPPSAV